MHFPKLALFFGSFGSAGSKLGVHMNTREWEVAKDEGNPITKLCHNLTQNRIVASASWALEVAIFHEYYCRASCGTLAYSQAFDIVLRVYYPKFKRRLNTSPSPAYKHEDDAHYHNPTDPQKTFHKQKYIIGYDKIKYVSLELIIYIYDFIFEKVFKLFASLRSSWSIHLVRLPQLRYSRHVCENGTSLDLVFGRCYYPGQNPRSS